MAARRCVIESGVQMAKMWGISDAAGALKGSLILAEGPMSMDDLVEETGYSKSTVSTNMTFLENQGVVRRVRKPGDKRNYYVAMQDMEEAFKAENNKFKQMVSVHLAAIDEAEEILERAEPSEEVDRLCHRLVSIREDCIKAQKLVDLVDNFSMSEIIEILERELSVRGAKNK